MLIEVGQSELPHRVHLVIILRVMYRIKSFFLFPHLFVNPKFAAFSVVLYCYCVTISFVIRNSAETSQCLLSYCRDFYSLISSNIWNDCCCSVCNYV